MKKSEEKRIQTINILLDRLERLSADSVWAHQASGLRGSLIRARTNILNDGQNVESVNELILLAHEILSKAAGEIPGDVE